MLKSMDMQAEKAATQAEVRPPSFMNRMSESFKNWLNAPGAQKLVPIYAFGTRALAHLFYRLQIIGFDEHIPKEGGAILVSNHVSYVDGVILFTACKRRVTFIIDEAIYNIPPVKHFMDLNGAIPIAPNRASVKAALKAASDVLSNGGLVYIFPEGSLTYTGNMTRFRFGIEWMLKDNPVPVIPIALGGLWGSILSRKYRNSKWKFLPRSFRRRVVAICGAPIPPEKASVGYLQRTVMRLKNQTGLK